MLHVVSHRRVALNCETQRQDIDFARGLDVPEDGTVEVSQQSLQSRLVWNKFESHNNSVIWLDVWQTVGQHKDNMFQRLHSGKGTVKTTDHAERHTPAVQVVFK